jgi:hypothetical protein
LDDLTHEMRRSVLLGGDELGSECRRLDRAADATCTEWAGPPRESALNLAHIIFSKIGICAMVFSLQVTRARRESGGKGKASRVAKIGTEEFFYLNPS